MAVSSARRSTSVSFHCRLSFLPSLSSHRGLLQGMHVPGQSQHPQGWGDEAPRTSCRAPGSSWEAAPRREALCREQGTAAPVPWETPPVGIGGGASGAAQHKVSRVSSVGLTLCTPSARAFISSGPCHLEAHYFSSQCFCLHCKALNALRILASYTENEILKRPQRTERTLLHDTTTRPPVLTQFNSSMILTVCQSPWSWMLPIPENNIGLYFMDLTLKETELISNDLQLAVEACSPQATDLSDHPCMSGDVWFSSVHFFELCKGTRTGN